MITPQKIEEIVKKIVEGYQPDKIILFGSYASGTHNEDSDLDLLIIKDTQEDTIERELKVSRLLHRAGIAYDVFVYNNQEVEEFSKDSHSFLNHMMMTGKVIYG